jgi:plastocyanin
MPVEGGGSVSGRVIYRGMPPERAPVAVTKDREVCGRTAHRAEGLVVGRGGGLQNAVVSIDPVTRGKPWPGGSKPVLDQRGCWFVPHLLLVPAGAEIDILNSDGILHNIHTHPKLNPPINLAQPKFKKVLNHAFARPETVRVVCDVHSWMNAWIVVAAHPYHAVTGEDGAFSLDQVPPASYTLKAWHETLGTSEQPVTVSPGGRVEATLAFGG